MSGELPRIEFNDSEFGIDESFSPIDITCLPLNDEQWLSEELLNASPKSSSHHSNESLNNISQTYEGDDFRTSTLCADIEFGKEEFVAPLVSTFPTMNDELAVAPSQFISHIPNENQSNQFPKPDMLREISQSERDVHNMMEKLSLLAPEPLLRSKFHPLCFCYRHPDDYDHHDPRVYSEGIPEDDDVAIYSKVTGDVTWGELKRDRPDTPNLHKVFPLLQWRQHNSEEEEHQRILFEHEEELRKEIEATKKAAENERSRLDNLFPRPGVKHQVEKPKSPNLKRSDNFLHGTNPVQQKLSNTQKPNLKQTKQYSSTINRRDQKNMVRSLNKVISLSDDCLRGKKIQRHIPFFSTEERIHYEVHGCTKLQLRERKAQEKRMKAGVRF